jgi:acetoin utilization deacetylase AcuC-like enzyme
VILTHPACLAHDPGPGHPECADRLAAVLRALAEPCFAALPRVEAPLATDAQLARAHAPALIARVQAASPAQGRARLDADTAMSPASLEAALRAAGAAVAAVDAVMAGHTQRAFCAVRPPGHHATRDIAMGFCLFNSIAVGAAHALAEHDLSRVVVVDFDVHHGNGTQDVFWNEPRVTYVSTHQAPLYPGTGAPAERGSVGNVLNLPLPPGAGPRQFRAAYADVILPAIDRLRPELILVSAGFDAHHLDPLANLNVDTADYAWLTAELVALADRHCSGRIVSMLEGGYSLTALRESTAAHCRALFGVA